MFFYEQQTILLAETGGGSGCCAPVGRIKDGDYVSDWWKYSMVA
jgi:hypothetical protein